ncbi:taste receptor type 2 member 8-like [Tupaia chinensis]|uniref:taste receptor type 2 member 8-like n=1 Tax=Tupaia chinensis TaxID=246437 RepID=UPI0007041F9F|nr:taste receptor type 2 member 8-like [Tupaia chinensis]
MLYIKDFLVIILTAEFLIGMLGNGYIGLVNWISWIKKKKISSIDYILTNLALSRICLIGAMVLNAIFLIFYPDVYDLNEVRVVVFTFWTLANYLSTWLATCLNVFYFLKIASFSHPLFLWLKWRIDRMVHWILLGCFVISLLVSFILAKVVICDYGYFKISKSKESITDIFHASKLQYFDPFTLFDISLLIPFIVSLISFLLLIMSLWRHTKQMKLSATGFRDPSTEAHVKAMKTVISSLFLRIMYYVASFVVTFSYLIRENILAIIFGEIFAILYPLGHSLILMIGNNKLRQTFVKMLKRRKITCTM